MESELSTQTTIRPAQILATRLGVSYHRPDSPSLPGTLAFETIRSAAGVDFIGTDGVDALFSLNETGAITVDAKGGNDTITLQDSDQVVGTATIKGGAGNDTIALTAESGGNNSRLASSSVNGGQGDDTIKGGRGADRIQLSRGNDQILDFKPQQGDRLINKNKFSFEATERDGNLILSDIENNTQITLHSISLITALAAQPELFS